MAKWEGWWSSDLFPTKLSFFVFISYMALFINQGILVTASKTKANTYVYNTTTVVLLTECVKLCAAFLAYIRENTFKMFLNAVVQNYKVFLLYFVPATLYCIYNNLAFVNLARYDPTTYFLFLQFRVVVTGVLFQILFSKKLSAWQWVSLLLLTLGCIVKEVHFDTTARNVVGHGGISESFPVSSGMIFILLQVFCSCFAGVYNEYLLKDRGIDVHIMMQNVFMYVDSIICNIIVLSFSGHLTSAFTATSIMSVLKPVVVAIIFNGAAIGIVTSLFLRSLNSILKTFASALELMFTAVLCWIIFGIPIDRYTVLAIAIVVLAIIVYSKNPVVNLPKSEKVTAASDKKEISLASLNSTKTELV